MKSDTKPRPPANLPEQAVEGAPPRRIVVRTHESEPPAPAPSTSATSAPPQPQGRSGCFWFMLFTLGVLAIIAAVLTVFIMGGYTTANNLVAGIGSIFEPQPAQVSVATSQTIVNRVQLLGELTTIRTQFAKADISVDIQQGVLNACSFSTNYVAQGEISAGVDLAQLDPESVRYDEATGVYTVTLPAPRLLGCQIDYIDQYAQSVTLCRVDADSARQLGQYITLLDFRDDAIENGILTQAEQQARLVLGNVIQSITGRDVEILFAAQPAEPILPASCRPDIPGEWRFSDVNQAWTKPE